MNKGKRAVGFSESPARCGGSCLQPGAQEAEPEGLLQLEGQAGLHSKYQTKPVLKTGSVLG